MENIPFQKISERPRRDRVAFEERFRAFEFRLEFRDVAVEHVDWAYRYGLSYPEIGRSVGAEILTSTREEAIGVVAAAWRNTHTRGA